MAIIVDRPITILIQINWMKSDEIVKVTPYYRKEMRG